MSFAVQLVLALAVTFAAVAAVGYVAVGRQVDRRLRSTYLAEHAADARAVEAVALRAPDVETALSEVDALLDDLASRPGVVEAVLIDRHGVARAIGMSATGVGGESPAVTAALRRGVSYSGPSVDPAHDARDFEVVDPVDLPGGHFALQVVRTHALLDAELRDLRRTLLLLAVLGSLGGAALFYVLGGRRLVRSHGIALRRALRDGLTDLPNDRAFGDDLERAVGVAARRGEPLALVLVDLDDFRFLNERHGRRHGDELLQRAAAVVSALRAGDRVYRIGGDEFALVLPATDAAGAVALAERLAAAFADAGLAASLGVADVAPGRAGGTLRGEAEAALLEAQRDRTSGIVPFDAIRDRVTVAAPQAVLALRRLLAERGVTTEFQPIWDIGTGALLGVEALTRPDPVYGLQGPAEAFDVAERIARSHELDALCIASALGGAARLAPGSLLFLNLSPATLDLDAGCDDWLAAAVADAGLAPQRIVVEVTERYGGRTAPVVASLRRLRAQGFRLAIDDVGTGNAGLEMLREVNADYVKIDRSIVTAAPTEPTARAVLVAMATFACETGAFVIAEGIEDRELLDFLQTVNAPAAKDVAIIRGAQGFGLGRPSPAIPPGDARLDALVAAHR